ncbi:hypothetical protein E2562_019611 [Oryza meyeriana var. granulata]|uniref:Uncharacterized protein n=1 Tax=Oryza meyeriana var. granulata TaxID=110450 RepID=A0A6G1C940_9ORYZ|nr:hypothetical protein E2562_019611 [Oryza meyeriana var. granulata]
MSFSIRLVDDPHSVEDWGSKNKRLLNTEKLIFKAESSRPVVIPRYVEYAEAKDLGVRRRYRVAGQDPWYAPCGGAVYASPLLGLAKSRRPDSGHRVTESWRAEDMESRSWRQMEGSRQRLPLAGSVAASPSRCTADSATT